MGNGEVVHCVLEITEIAEKVLQGVSLRPVYWKGERYLAHLADGFDFGWGRNCGSVGAVLLHGHARWGWMSYYEAGNHDEE